VIVLHPLGELERPGSDRLEHWIERGDRGLVDDLERGGEIG
jgi:hypothetical protein